MKHIFLLLLYVLIIGCSRQRSNELVGVWYHIENGSPNHYYEIHVTDTGFVAVNENGISYLSSYTLKSDTLSLTIRDIYNNRKQSGFLVFEVMVVNDSLKMININNRERVTELKRISNLKPFEFYENQPIDSFAKAFKNRYLLNCAAKAWSKKQVDTALAQFDRAWNISKK